MRRLGIVVLVALVLAGVVSPVCATSDVLGWRAADPAPRQSNISPALTSTTPAVAPVHYDSISEIRDAGSSTAQVQSCYSEISDVQGLPDGSLVELECKGVCGTGTETVDGIEYSYFDVIENAPETDSIRCYYSQAVSASARINRITGQIRHTDPDTPVIDVDTGPGGYDPQLLVGTVQTVEEGSIPYACTCPDGVEVTLSAKVVTADRTDLSGNRLYIEEPDASAGILVVYAGSEESIRGATVDVTGTVNTLSSGERWVDAGFSGITIITPGEPVPGVLELINSACGGSGFNMFTPGVDTPASADPYNVGALIKTSGRVTEAYPSEKCFYLDDGSHLDDTNSHGALGIKVSWDWQAISQMNPEVVSPTPGWYTTATGISGIESTATGGRARVLRVRGQADVYPLPDDFPPTPGTASSPSYVTASPIAVTYSGASDSISGLSKVELWYKKGHTGTWTYSDSYCTTPSGSFSFPVSEDSTYYFDLIAQDNAGNRSAAPTGDGDCRTIYEPGGISSTTGRVFSHCEYLYPGGPAVRSTLYDESGAAFRDAITTLGPEGEVLTVSGDTPSVTYTYDSVYRTRSISDGLGHTTAFVYDDDGNSTTADPPVGNLCRITYPGGDAVKFSEHDAYGRPQVRDTTNPALTTRYHYDDTEGLLSQIEYPATLSQNVSFAYDPDYGYLTQITDPTGTTNYTCDDLDIIKTVATTYKAPQSGNLPTWTVGYDYYPNGNLETTTLYKAGVSSGSYGYSYDLAGRPTSLTNPFSESFTWDYFDNDGLNHQTMPVATTAYAYNPRGFLTSLVNSKPDESLLSSFGGASGLAYDAAGNLLSMTADIPASSTLSGDTSFSYDSLSQLTNELSARNSSYSNGFAYDSAGNPTTFKAATNTFNANNQNTAFTYDGNGNPTSYKGSALTYDAENRLTAYAGAMTAGYTVDGLRAWKQVGTNRTYFLYSGGVPVCELDSSGNLIATNTFGPTGLLSRHTSAGSSFYTFDPQGSVVQVLSSGGAVSSTQAYDAYGSPLSGTTACVPFGYGGQFGYYTDSETGLQLLGHRYYDPANGRFLTRDPIGYAGGMNLYGYVEGNPVNAVDPSGFCGKGSWSSHLPIVGTPFTEAGTAYANWEMGRGSGWVALGKGGKALGGVVIAGGVVFAGGEIAAGGGTVYNVALHGYVYVTTATAAVGGLLSSGEAEEAGEAAGHHPVPQYLGGPSEQELEPLESGLHAAYHGGLSRVLPTRYGAAYYRSLSGAEQAENFATFYEYTTAFDAVHGTDLWGAVVREMTRY